MTEKEAYDFLGITKWHELGYKGQGMKFVGGELTTDDFKSNYTDKLKDIVRLHGFGSGSQAKHGKEMFIHTLTVIPEATIISSAKSKSYDYILENGADVFATALVSRTEISEEKEEKMQRCIDNGCLFFIAAGNYGENGLAGESKSDKYWSIGGVEFVNNKWRKANYSSYGKDLDFVGISNMLGVSGTSPITYIFASMVTLVQQFFKERTGRKLTRDEMIRFIKDNCIDILGEGFDVESGYGLFVLPNPDEIDIKKYVNTYIDYGGVPQMEDIKIKQMLLTPSQYTRPQTKINPTAIAWHYVGNKNTSALANRNYFESLSKTHSTKASCHFIIGIEGEILQLIPENEMSYCTNQANSYTISIECCHPDDTGKFTEATYRSMIWLGKYLMQKFSIKNNIRHYDVTGKLCPLWFVNNPKEWEKFKKELETEESEVIEMRYKTLEEMPEYYRKDIGELIDSGVIAGRGGDLGLDLSDDMCRMAIYAKKIFEKGGK